MGGTITRCYFAILICFRGWDLGGTEGAHHELLAVARAHGQSHKIMSCQWKKLFFDAASLQRLQDVKNETQSS